MIQRKNPDLDIVKELLNAVLANNPSSTFVQSLSYQYEERGGLSKKQLEGLYQKASKINTIPVNRLATLEAMLLKRPNRFKSALPPAKPFYEEKDKKQGEMIEAILLKYPLHKRVLFFKSKYDNNETLSPADNSELEKFYKFLN